MVSSRLIIFLLTSDFAGAIAPFTSHKNIFKRAVSTGRAAIALYLVPALSVAITLRADHHHTVGSGNMTTSKTYKATIRPKNRIEVTICSIQNFMSSFMQTSS
jgi:hypothetical protein